MSKLKGDVVHNIAISQLGEGGKLREYLEELVGYFNAADVGVVSLIVFGSAVTGGFSNQNSDVDILVVIDDGTPKKYKKSVLQQIKKLEVKYGFAEDVNNPFKKIRQSFLHMMSLKLSHFICYKRDFIGGRFARIFHISLLLQFMASASKIAFAGLLQSAQTFWGADLLKQVHIKPIRKRHLLMSFVSVFNISLAAFFLYPFSGKATKMAMGALKAAIHNCSFCYGLSNAPLSDKTAFLISKFPQKQVLQDFLLLRNEYKNSFRFVSGVIGIIGRIYLKTLKEISFPIEIKKSYINV